MTQRDSDQSCPGPLNNFHIGSAQILNSEISFNSIIWDFISAMIHSFGFISCCVFPGSSLHLGVLGLCAGSLTTTPAALPLMSVLLCPAVCSDSVGPKWE